MLNWVIKHRKAVAIAVLIIIVLFVAFIIFTIDWVQIEMDARVRECRAECEAFDGDEWVTCMGLCVSE